MAKPASFNKRDIEKKKAEKRKQKQQKKEDKKTNGKNSLDDMIAYVDENGRITSEPPLEQKKETINPEDIVISVPKQEETGLPSEYEGRVEHYNTSKGFGFIKDINSTDKYFFHASNAPHDLQEGDFVLFELERGKKGMNAVNIIIKKTAIKQEKNTDIE